jgi:alcohol dehydrogenase (NADP+)
MIQSRGYAALQARATLAPFDFERRDPGTHDVLIQILYCGICHSDIHQVNDDWHFSVYPMVPGHEIIGRVVGAGSAVTKFAPGDLAGVGCMVDSDRTCPACQAGDEQFCHTGATFTYNGSDKRHGGLAQGGYSNNIVVDEAFALKISPKLDPAAAAPLLCAGITTYSPLRRWNVGPGKKLGVIGLGGLGHMALKLGRSFGAQVTQFTTSLSKKEDALRLGAHEVVLSKDANAMRAQAGSFDVILDTVSAPHDINALIGLLKPRGAMAVVGMPGVPLPLDLGGLIMGERLITGSLIGGIRPTQEMLDYCAAHGIVSDIELIPIQKVNEAFERTVKSDVKYRFVIDLATL